VDSVLHTFLEDFEEKAKKDILHGNKVVWRSVWMGSIFGVLLIGFIILILSLVFSFGPLWYQVLLVVAYSCGWTRMHRR
jgi:membrane protein YdbS with pleckstrin-like domain